VFERTSVCDFQTNRFGFDQFGLLAIQDTIMAFKLNAMRRDTEKGKPM
jgi:hypothetical protein